MELARGAVPTNSNDARGTGTRQAFHMPLAYIFALAQPSTRQIPTVATAKAVRRRVLDCRKNLQQIDSNNRSGYYRNVIVHWQL